MSVEVVKVQTDEYRITVKKDDPELARQYAIDAGISAEAALLSAIAAAESEQSSIEKAAESNEFAIQSGQSAAGSLASRNEAAAILANTLTGGAVAGQIPFWNAPKNLIGESSFVWDNVNKRLGVNAVSPTEILDVNGRIRARLIDNGVGNILTKTATGIITERTPIQTATDILTALPTYNGAINQTLQHTSSGVLQWV